MQALLIKRPGRVMAIAALVLSIGALVAFALLSAGSAQAKAHHAGTHARHHAAFVSDTTGANDPGTAQSGDQSTPDASSGESTVESEQGQPGEPANGHQDAPGTAGSDCQGDCVQ
jgi:hypothetical protein